MQDGKSKNQPLRKQLTQMDGNGQIQFGWPLYLLLWARISWKKWSSLHSQQSCLKCSAWMQSQKRQISVHFQGKPFNITIIQLYAPNTNIKETEVEHFCEDLQHLLEHQREKKNCPFHHRGLECKSRKSRDTWSNKQVWPWSTKCCWAKANRVLPRECTSHSKQPLPTTQEITPHRYHQMINTKMRWSIPK